MSINARCRECGFKFIGMSETEFKRSAARHIKEAHPNAPVDDTIIDFREVPG